MKEQNEKKKITSKKRAYLYTALASVAVVLTLIIVVVSVSYTNTPPSDPPAVEDDLNKNPSVEVPGDNQSGVEDDKPVDSLGDGFVLPVANASLTNEFGFFYNQTLNNYYAHEGLDFKAEAGGQVVAVEDGTVESVYVADVLHGTEIVIDHGNGVKTVYRFVTAKDGVKAGTRVEKGEVIATVAEANGSEYKDGAHLHFEVRKDGKYVDPTTYLTLEEK